MMVVPVHELVAGASQVATSAVAAALWQGLLLAGAAAIGMRLLPQTPAPVRFAIWFAVFGLIGILPFATISFGHSATSGSAVISHPWLTLDARWCFWIAAVWAVASLLRAVTLVAAAFRVRALWKRARLFDVSVGCLGGGKTTEILRFAQDDTSRNIGDDNSRTAIARGAQVCVSDEVDRPTVIGFFAPRILIPEWLIAKLSPEELEQVVLHEAGHLSRGDDWLNLLQKLALVVFPLNPALVWVERRLCYERELACDERVLHATGEPKAYAECLATLAEYRLQRRGLVHGLVLALGALGRESELTKRVLRILSGGARMKKNHARLVFGGSMLTLVFAASAMERSPQLIGFTQQGTRNGEQATGISAAHRIPHAAAFQAMAVRASVAPAQEWKTVGDAMPRVARRSSGTSARALVSKSVEQANAGTSAAQAAIATRAIYGTAEAVPLSKAGSEVQAKSVAGDAPYTPEVIQTVATTRQMTADGRVLVTRMVTVRAYNVSSSDATRPISDVSQSDAQQNAGAQQQQIVYPYAAVPVQGGWLVFQL